MPQMFSEYSSKGSKNQSKSVGKPMIRKVSVKPVMVNGVRKWRIKNPSTPRLRNLIDDGILKRFFPNKNLSETEIIDIPESLARRLIYRSARNRCIRRGVCRRNGGDVPGPGNKRNMKGDIDPPEIR